VVTADIETSRKKAAKKAGILDHRPIGKTTLILVEEPEAAAMCTLFDRRKHPEITVSPIAPTASGLQLRLCSYQVTT